MLGFAFERDGSLTVAFVFDPRRGVIEGKLVGWSAVFDEAHVLVTSAMEKRGRLEHTAHLVDAHGTVIATDRSGELLVGPGGSIFVVIHDAINHLCFARD